MKLIRKVSKGGCLSFGSGLEPSDRPRHWFYLDGKSDGFEKPPPNMSVILIAPYPFRVSGQVVRSTRITYQDKISL